MFKRLHRLYVLAYWGVWLAVALFLYSRRALLQPAVDYARIAWQRPADAPASFPTLTGVVTRVYSGDGFQVRNRSGTLFNFGLAGVSAPRTNRVSTAEEREFHQAGVAFLDGLLSGSEVKIDITLSNPGTSTGLGVVWVGQTNVNERVLAQGYARLRHDQVRSLPVRTQYAMARAERLARQQKLGLWVHGTPEDAP